MATVERDHCCEQHATQTLPDLLTLVCWLLRLKLLVHLYAAGHQVGDGFLTAALEPVKDEVPVLFHLHGGERETSLYLYFPNEVNCPNKEKD